MDKQRNISQIRRDYSQQELLESSVCSDPSIEFDRWLQEAIDAQCPEPTAMTLATCNTRGETSARVVLLKGADTRGFTFFTNYLSRKGAELDAHPNAAIVFFWSELERQVRVEGIVERIGEVDSDRYFASRPRGSQIGAWASPQSRVVNGRAHLERLVGEKQQFYTDKNVPRPPHWGGYILKPIHYEFWQGRSNRLHDRICYTLAGNSWVIERLAP